MADCVIGMRELRGHCALYDESLHTQDRNHSALRLCAAEIIAATAI
jgi:hypothetical protein